VFDEKIEVAFDDIDGLGIEEQDDGTMLIIYQLSRPPRYWIGIMQPNQAQTKWNHAQDFTNGEVQSEEVVQRQF